jgi:hypothetical protein
MPRGGRSERALDLAHSSRVGFTRDGPGPQLPLLPRLGPPFEYDSHNMLQPRVRIGNDRLYTPTDGFQGLFVPVPIAVTDSDNWTQEISGMKINLLLVISMQ